MHTLRKRLRWADNERQRYRFLKMSSFAKRELLNNWFEPCCICQKVFESDHEKVVHHCHLTGTVFGVAHSSCNLLVTVGSFLRVFFHNLSRYDAHHIIKYMKLEENETLGQKRRLFRSQFRFPLEVT